MIFCKPRDVRRLSAGSPSPILSYLAGEFAARIAGLWPAPHAAFLTATAPRRHLICLALVHADDDAEIDVHTLLDRPLRRAVQAVMPDAPCGVARALERLGERAWSEEDYRRLLRLLAIPRSAKLLHHRDSIDADAVRAMTHLPDAMLEHGPGVPQIGEAAAILIAEASAAIARRDGADVAGAAAKRWASAETLAKLIEWVRFDLEPEVAPPPFPGTERLRPIRSKAALIDAAARYKNCLRNYLGCACSGTSAFYEWSEEPGLVLEIFRDRLHGWALSQARLAGNKPVPEPLREEVVRELRSMGVTVDRTLWHLDDALDDIIVAPSTPTRTRAAVIGDMFGD